MAHYLVKAQVKTLEGLHGKLKHGEISKLSPFGEELHDCLLDARVMPDGTVTWEETCYCSPPLKQERSVLDLHFADIETQVIREGEGWEQIEHLPRLLPVK